MWKFLEKLLNVWEEIGPALDWGLLHGNGETAVEEYILGVLQVIIGLGGIFAACMIVYGAYVFILSGGDFENAAKGQKVITNAVIGLILAAITFMVINFVVDTIGGEDYSDDLLVYLQQDY